MTNTFSDRPPIDLESKNCYSLDLHSDFEDNKKEFWSLVGRRTKGRKGEIEALRCICNSVVQGQIEGFTESQRLGSCI